MDDVHLLGNSQTFIGVIATVVILCVVTGAGNFLHTILKSILEPSKQKIENFRSELNRLSLSLRERPIYTRFSKLQSDISDKNKSELDDEDPLINAANQHRVMCDVSIDEFTNKFNGMLLVPFDNLVSGIHNSREQTFGPLYVFGYCIIVFLCDEIASWQMFSLPIVVSFLTIFTLLSILFLSGMWYKFNSEFCSSRNTTTIPPQDTTPPKFSATKSVYTFYDKALFPFILLIAILYLVETYVLHIHVYGVRVLVLASIVTPFCILGHKHIFIRKSLGKHSHSFLLGHFCLICALSMMYTLLLILPFDFLLSAKVPYSDRLWEIQATIIVFTILFGLILPFWIPYHCHLYIDRQVDSHFNRSKEVMSTEIQNIELSIENYISDLEYLILIDDEIDYYSDSVLGADCCTISMSSIKDDIKKKV